MRYMFLIYTHDSMAGQASPEEEKAVMDAYWAFTSAVEGAGVLKSSDALQPTSTATTVRVRNGKVLTTDGPFAETKEQLGGYYILDCKDLNEAIQWAAKIPGVKYAPVEIRPIVEFN